MPLPLKNIQLPWKPIFGRIDMKNFFAAIRFITILPAGRSEHFDAMGMVPWFPVTGLLLGALLAVFDLAAVRLWPV
jgi:adenosylcobinamide-GDP ribazoletransferase